VRSLRALLLSIAFAAGCGGAQPDASSLPETADAPPKPKPKDAAQRVEALADGKVGALVYVDRVRAHPVGPRLLAMPVVAQMLEGTGIDPLKDLERVFVSGPGTDRARAVMFAEHNLDAARAHAALESVMQKSDPPGERVSVVPYEAVKVTVKGRTGVVAMLPPRYVVVLPEDLAPRIASFDGTGGLVDPTGPEAALAIALDPSRTVRGPHVPRIPEGISRATARVVLRPDGGADVDVVGETSGPDVAAEDARALTSEIERVTTVKVAFVTFRVMDPIPFVAEGNQVKAHVGLSHGQLDQLVGLAERFTPR
jgi:hypothetical protein